MARLSMRLTRMVRNVVTIALPAIGCERTQGNFIDRTED